MRFAKRILATKAFDRVVLIIILFNAFLLGIETYNIGNEKWIDYIQVGILVIFAIELLIRWQEAPNMNTFFASGWNTLDMIIMVACILTAGGSYIHTSLGGNTHLENTDIISTLHILRTFRLLRLIEAFPELKLITSVLLRSVRSVSYIGVLFLIFAYLYAVVGVALFKLPPKHFPPGQPDPYGNILEALFTLFRAMTGDNWTDLRYNLLSVNASRTMDVVVTIYHASWMVVSAFLLLNLLVGAVLNNFDELKNRDMKRKRPRAKTA
ncbi:MAG: ion transporter [Myxococcota bacterium]